MNALKTMTKEAALSYLRKKLSSDNIITVDMGDTIVIKQGIKKFKEWASPIWKESKKERLTAREIKAIIKEARMGA